MRRLAVLAFLALTLAACRDPNSYNRNGWDGAGMSFGRDLATKVKDSAYGCDQLQEDPWGPFVSGYQTAGLPAPLASLSCRSPALGEGLTIETFTSPEAARAFVAAKVKVLCEKGKEIPGFEKVPYVDGGTWIVEPDTMAGARRLTEVLGGDAKTMCP